MTTREQRLREFVEWCRENEPLNGSVSYIGGFNAAMNKCADRILAILAEPVEVSEEMVIRSAKAAFDQYKIDTVYRNNDWLDIHPSEYERWIRAATAALKEPGQ